MGKQVLDAFGRVDILVNAAAAPGGQQPPPRLHEIDDGNFDGEMHTKVLGYLRVRPRVRAVDARERLGPDHQHQRHGRAPDRHDPGSVRNVAVVALSKNLADELGPHGINVTVVHPGTTRTERSEDVIAARAEATGADHRRGGEADGGRQHDPPLRGCARRWRTS